MITKFTKISDLKLNDKNPRTIDRIKLDKLVKSIKDFPEMLNLRPIVVDSNNVVLGGNMRLQAAKKAGLKEIPTLCAIELNDDQKKEFIIKDNVGFGEWDYDALKLDWDCEKLIDWGLDLPDFKIEEETIEEDDVETEGVQTKIVLGDLIEIGNHRLICGDSTNPDHVDKVLNGEKPYLMITDPPYGVEYDAKWRQDLKGGKHAIGKVNNDDKSDWSESWSLSPSSVAYIYHASSHSNSVYISMINNDFILRNQIIWNKNSLIISRGHYHNKHEPCFYFVKKGCSANWIGDRKQTTVWDIDKNQKNESGHSTQKPIECMARPIRNHEGDVYEPFSGSGTTFVASEQLNRRCFGIEINPSYCQVIIDRMIKLFPKLDIKINGESYDKKTM